MYAYEMYEYVKFKKYVIHIIYNIYKSIYYISIKKVILYIFSGICINKFKIYNLFYFSNSFCVPIYKVTSINRVSNTTVLAVAIACTYIRVCVTKFTLSFIYCISDTIWAQALLPGVYRNNALACVRFGQHQL